MAIKLAVAQGAEVYAFTTTESKVKDILSFGAREAILVDSMDKLRAYNKSLDYMISTIPVDYDIAAYSSTVKPYRTFTQVGMPIGFQVKINNLGLASSRVNYNASLVGGIRQTQELVDYCAQQKIYPQVQVIKAKEVNEAWRKVIDKEARYRQVCH